MSLFLSSRGDEFPFSAGTIFIRGEPRGPRENAFTSARANNGRSCFSRDRGAYSASAPATFISRCREPWRCHMPLNIASAIRLRDLSPPPEIRASNYDGCDAKRRERERLAAVTRNKMQSIFPETIFYFPRSLLVDRHVWIIYA